MLFKQTDNRIRILVNKENLHIVKSLSKAIPFAKGTYIAKVDDDLVESSIISVNENSKKIEKIRNPNNQTLITKSIAFNLPIVHHWLAKKTLYNTLNGYRNFYVGEDLDFLSRAITSDYKATNHIDYYGSYVRISTNNNIFSNNAYADLFSINYIHRLYKEQLKNKTNEDSYSFIEYKKHIYRFKWISPFIKQSVFVSQKATKELKNSILIYTHFLLNLILLQIISI